MRILSLFNQEVATTCRLMLKSVAKYAISIIRRKFEKIIFEQLGPVANREEQEAWTNSRSWKAVWQVIESKMHSTYTIAKNSIRSKELSTGNWQVCSAPI